MCEHSSAIGRQIGEQLMLRTCQFDLVIVTLHNMPCKVNYDGSGLDDFVLSALRSSGMTERHAHTRQKFFDAKWFGQVIIRALIKCSDLIAFTISYRENDDRALRPFTQARANFHTIHIWQTQIENHNIGFNRRRQCESLFTATGSGNLELLLGENGAHGTQDLLLIIDDENMWCVVHHSISVSVGNCGDATPSQISGKVKLKARPSDTFAAQMRPPCASMIPLQIERPSPVPVTRSAAVIR